MSEKRFVCIDIGYGDDWYITDDGKRLSEMEIVELLNEQQATISQLEEENKKLREEWEFSFRTEMAHHRFAEKELQEKIREKQATIKSKDKQLERLYNYFQDYLKDEMGGNAFSEMWDFVKEDERWNDE